MALQSNDLFFVNRSNTTYKIKASEIGDFIVGDPNNGVPGYVNDGKLIVSDSKGAYDLFSANTKVDSVLDFDENFTLTNTSDGACVGIDFGAFKNNLICDVDSGFLDNNCECLAIDPEWISANLDFDILIENLICDDGSGLTNQNGCLAVDISPGGGIIIDGSGGIAINICDDGGLAIDPNDNCIYVDLNPGGGIIDNGDGLEINICSKDSGLEIDSNSGCLSVDFEKVTEKLEICDDGGLVFDSNSKCLSVDFNETTGNIAICPGGGLEINTDVNGNHCLSVIDSGSGGSIIGPGTPGSCSNSSNCPDGYHCVDGKCYPDPDKHPEGAFWWHDDKIDGRLYVNYKDRDGNPIWVDASPRAGANAKI